MSDFDETISNLYDLLEKILEETIDLSDFDDLTQPQLQYLKVIVKMKNPTITELARELGLTKPTVSVLVDKLTGKGYIRRVQSDEDRRVLHLHIDKKGERIVALRELAHTRMAEKIKTGLSESEKELLTRLLNKIINC